MKWYKQETKTHTDEKIRDLIYSHGLAAYGAYIILLELIAEKIDHEQKPEIRINFMVLKGILQVSERKMDGFLRFFNQNELIFCDFSEGYYTLRCPNLLKRLDNWTKRSVVTIEQVPENDPLNKNKKENKKEKKQAAPDFIESLKTNLAFKDLDIDKELGKCQAWCSVHRKIPTARRFVNWLNGADRPLAPKIQKSTSAAVNTSRDQIEKWKKEAAPMPDECKKQLESLGIRSRV